jgi:hypothetical protein
VRLSGIPILVILTFICSTAIAADQPADPSAGSVADSVTIKATRAQCWDAGQSSVVELTGPVQIELTGTQAGTKMSARNAVVWIDPNPDGPADSHRLQIALIGDGQLQQEGVLRLDRRLLVKAVITGKIELIGERAMGPDESSPLYQDALALREGKPPATNPAEPATAPAAVPAPVLPLQGLTPLAPLPGSMPASRPEPNQSPWAPRPSTPSAPPTLPTTAPAVPQRVLEFDGDYQRAITPDGNIAAVVSNGVNLIYRDEKQNLIEFSARNMVVFTNLKELKGALAGQTPKQFITEHIVSAYFEGDVRVFFTPANNTSNELRLRAEHVYYEFATDRAIMTDVVLHTVDLKKQLPIFMRASKLRQLSQTEFNFDGVELTDSAFANPTYSIHAAHAYVRTDETDDATTGTRVTFRSDNVTATAVGVPFFYFPVVGGTMDSKGFPLRTIDFNDNTTYGVGLRSKWGLFETLGMVPPKDLDVTFSADYLSKRGPGGGLDGEYKGDFIDDATAQPWNFQGDLHSYFVDDHGTDILGAARNDEAAPQDFRGRLVFEHTLNSPGGWQAQLRAGYVSDSNFMTQWFNNEYQNGLPIEESLNLKHTNESEQFSFYAETQPNRAISTADEEEENREVSRLPEIQYNREGDSLLQDHLTFFSENSGSALKFVRNEQSLTQQGFFPGVEPGLPSYAYTGDPGDTTYRGDFREELDYPINAGVFKVVPYVFVRYTPYSQGVVPGRFTPQTRSLVPYVQTSDPINRLMAGGGLRLTTAFWKTDNSVESDLFDLHRIRHVIEPEINVFGSTSNVDQNRVFIYDPNVDGVNDVTAVQLALRQRWQTKRGGPGRWRSVDVLSINTYLNIFGNQPANRFRDPIDFRGLYYYSNPEASVARNSANADITWRVSDSTAVLADLEQNLDKVRLATASIGLAVLRDQRLSYFIGTRYIADLDSNIITLEANYKLDDKYSIAASQSIDLAQSKDVFYSFSLIRNFDTLSMSARFYFDQSTSDHGFSFSIQPFGFGKTASASQQGVDR